MPRQNLLRAWGLLLFFLSLYCIGESWKCQKFEQIPSVKRFFLGEWLLMLFRPLVEAQVLLKVSPLSFS